MTISWRDRVNYLLDQAERSPEARVTVSGIAKQVGKNRTTLWRDDQIKARFQHLSGLRGKSKRRGIDERIRSLTYQVDQLQKDNDRLLQNFIVVCRRLAEQGIDPVSVLGSFTPDQQVNDWVKAILPWEDQ